MKSNLNIPTIHYSIPSKIPPSFILYTSDKLFGDHYVLYEHNYNTLMTKELPQCYRVHADYLNKYTSERYLRIIEQQYI